jgi:hypothetical protein
MLRVKPELKDFVRPSDHSVYSPSSIERFIECPGSIRVCKDIPEIAAGVYAEEGTMAHTLAELTFYQDMYEIDIPQEVYDEVNTWKSASDMTQGAYIYSNEVQNWLKNPEVGEVIWFGLEKGIPIFPEEGAFGTGDCTIVGDKACVIIDYKFGKRKVHADAPQLRAYAAGVLRHLENVPSDYRIYTVIVQPRVEFAASVHVYTVEEIEEFTKDIWDMIGETKKPNAPLKRGSKHCFFCPANQTKDPALKCPLIKAEMVTVSEENFQGYLRDISAPVESLSVPSVKRDEALKKLILFAPIIADAAKRAEEEFTYRIEENNESIPGLEIVEAVGRRSWSDESSVLAALETKFPKLADKFVKIIPESRKLRGIGEVEKILGKSKTEINDLTVSPITRKLKMLDEEQYSLAEKFNNYVTNED